MRTKLIGVTPRVLYEDKVRKQFVNERYIVQLHKRGFNTILLTLDNPNISDVLSLCDGFLLTGGWDFDPKHYNEINSGLSQGIDHAIDTIDQQVVAYASKHKLPMLGICRGHQAINVFMGGSLYQDIKNHSGLTHKVKSIKNSVLALPDEFETNSWHHQAIKKTADGFKVIAVHEDNTIEAMIHTSLPIISVQWHPEIMPDDPQTKIIFDSFSKFFD